MADTTGITVRGAKEVAAKLQKASGTIQHDMIKWLLQAALHVEGTIREVIFRTLTKSPTGNLARSFKARVLRGSGSDVSAGVFSNLIYAKIHDEGGTITPRTGKNLAIPLNQAAKRRWPREWSKGTLRFAKMRGKKFLVDQNGKPQYLLKQSVSIRGRHYLKISMREAMPGVRKFLGEKVRLAIK